MATDRKMKDIKICYGPKSKKFYIRGTDDNGNICRLSKYGTWRDEKTKNNTVNFFRSKEVAMRYWRLFLGKRKIKFSQRAKNHLRIR